MVATTRAELQQAAPAVGQAKVGSLYQIVFPSELDAHDFLDLMPKEEVREDAFVVDSDGQATVTIMVRSLAPDQIRDLCKRSNIKEFDLQQVARGVNQYSEYNPLADAKQHGQSHSSKPATTIQTTAKMATTQTQGGQNRQQSAAQEPAPEPIDTGLASPLAPGNIFDLGNRFHIPGSPTDKEEVYKFVNGRHFNAIEALSVALAKKTGQESPRFAFRKGTKDEATGRIDYFGGQVYEAPAQLTEKGFKVVIIQKENEGQGQRTGQSNQNRGADQSRSNYGGNGNGRGGNGNGRGSYGGGGQRGSQKEDTGESTMFGKVVRLGNKYLIGDLELPIYAQVGGHDFTPKEIVAIVDSEGKRKRGERVPAPIIRFPGRDGQPDYDRAVEVNLDSGQIFRKAVPGQDRGGEEQYVPQGRGQERGGNNHQGRPTPGPATAADFGGNDVDFDQSQQGGEANDGEGVDGGVDDDIPDEFQNAAPAPRGRGR